MSKIFKSIKQGVSAAVDFGEGNIKHVTTHKYAPVVLKAIRRNVHMTQTEFADSEFHG